MKITPIKTKLFREGESISDFVLAHIQRLKNGAVLVVSSKIVSLSEGRTADPKDRERFIKREATYAVKAKKVWLTEKDGIIMANAGIDESNGNGKIILLPKNSYKSAEKLRSALKRKFGIKKLGVIISDSIVTPRRKGVVGIALGYAGFKGIRDYKGKKDLFGRKFRFASSNVADSLATAAMLTMGEGSEQHPIALIENSRIVFSEKTKKKEMHIPPQEDMFRF